MKAEHRKELQTNALADSVGRLIQNVRSRPDSTSLAALAILVLAGGIFLGWWWWSNYSEKTRSAQWLLLDEARNLNTLNKVAEEGGSAGRIARFQKARVLLREGLENLASYKPDPNAGEEEKAKNPPPREKIEQARDLYAKLADESRDSPLLAQEALMGVAKAKESLGDLDGALAGYKTLAERYPKSFLGEQAKRRADQLEERKAQYEAFYQEFEKLNSGK